MTVGTLFFASPFGFNDQGVMGDDSGHVPMKSIDLRGATDILNIGVDSHPAGRDDLTLRFLLGGYVGEREGVTGEVRLTYVF